MNMIFGKRLKQARKKKKMTMQALADQMDVTSVTVSRWESGTNEPNIEMINRLAEILDTSVSYLMGKDSVGDGISIFASLLDIAYKYKNAPHIDNDQLQVALYIVMEIEKELVRRIDDATDNS